MKIIIDTNVLISAFLFSGLSADVYDYCYIYHEIYISKWIINELIEKLELKFKIPKKEITKIILQLKQGCKIINPEGQTPNICRDKDDNNILCLGKFIKSDFIITGDSDLLDIKLFENIKIVNPREFWTLIKKL